MRALYLASLFVLASGAVAQPVSDRLDPEWGDGGIIRPHYYGHSASVSIGDNGEAGVVASHGGEGGAVHFASPWTQEPGQSYLRFLASDSDLGGPATRTQFYFSQTDSDSERFYVSGYNHSYSNDPSFPQPFVFRFTGDGYDTSFGDEGKINLEGVLGPALPSSGGLISATKGAVLVHKERLYYLFQSAAVANQCGVLVMDLDGRPDSAAGSNGVVLFEGEDACRTTAFAGDGMSLVRTSSDREGEFLITTIQRYDLLGSPEGERVTVTLGNEEEQLGMGEVIPGLGGNYYGVSIFYYRGRTYGRVQRYTESGSLDQEYNHGQGGFLFFGDGAGFGLSVGFAEARDGRVVVVYSYRPFEYNGNMTLWSIQRHPDGTRDTNWGPSFLFEEPPRGNEGHPRFDVHDVEFAADGGVYIAGSHNIPIISQTTRRLFLIKTRGDGRATSTSPEASGEPLALSIAPNPSHGAATLHFETTAPEAVRVQVVDRLGRVVLTVPEREVASGEHAVPLDLSGLSAGVYTAIVASGERQRTARLTVVR